MRCEESEFPRTCFSIDVSSSVQFELKNSAALNRRARLSCESRIMGVSLIREAEEAQKRARIVCIVSA